MILNKNQKIYFYLFGIFSLVISSIMGENSSGGSKLDNEITRQFIDNFLISFDNGIKYFINSGQVQSPIFYILASFIEKILIINTTSSFSHFCNSVQFTFFGFVLKILASLIILLASILKDHIESLKNYV